MSSAAFLARFGAGPSPEEEQSESPVASLADEGGAAAFVNRFAGFAGESFYFYENTVEIRFDKVNHIYYRVGELGELIPVLNVSTVSKIIDRSPALIPWAAKVTVEKLLRTIPTEHAPGPPDAVPTLLVPGMTFEEFSKIAMAAKSAHSDKLEDAGDVGKMAHDWLENYIKALMANDQAAVQGLMTQMCPDPRAANCVLAALDWMKAHNVRWLDTERKVFSRTHDCSGTLDGRCIVDSCTDKACCPNEFKDRKSLLDWKTSNFLYTEFVFQASAYFHFFLEEFPSETLEDIWILRLGKEDGEFQPWHLEIDEVPVCFQGFLACLALKRMVLKTEEQMKERKAAIRAVKKQQRAEDKERRKAEEKAAKKAAKEEVKAARMAEKEKIKAEAKAERERLKAEKKKEKACTSSESSSTASVTPTVSMSDTTIPVDASMLKKASPMPTITEVSTEPESQPEPLLTSSTEETPKCDSSAGSVAVTTSSVAVPVASSETGNVASLVLSGPEKKFLVEESDERFVFQIPTED